LTGNQSPFCSFPVHHNKRLQGYFSGLKDTASGAEHLKQVNVIIIIVTPILPVIGLLYVSNNSSYLPAFAQFHTHVPTAQKSALSPHAVTVHESRLLQG